MTGLFETLKTEAQTPWKAYTHHAFVAGLADGTLPEAAFRHYLIQDYIFLKHFARAYALAVYKSETLNQMRAAAASVDALLNMEMSLHVAYCAKWGLDEAAMEAVDEDPACMAYTRYVLERGMAGDLLDLKVALSPCVVGYWEIGKRLLDDPATKKDGNPYLPWIEVYSGDEYRTVAEAAVQELDTLWRQVGNEGRLPTVKRTFAEATRLEVGFWQMGLDAV